MRLLLNVMIERPPGQLAPVRVDEALAAQVIRDVLGVEVGEISSASHEHAIDDYWVDLDDAIVEVHIVAPNIMQAYRRGVGVVAASLVPPPPSEPDLPDGIEPEATVG